MALELNTGICPLVNVNTYNSLLEPELRDEVSDLVEHHGCSEEAADRYLDRFWMRFDHKAYLEGVCKIAVDEMNKFFLKDSDAAGLRRVKSLEGFELVSAYSPREYNFSGDELNFKLMGDEDAIIEECLAIATLEKDNILEFICKWQSRDGFISFMPYTEDNFFEALTTRNDDTERAVAMVLDYLVDENAKESLYETLYYAVSEKISVESYSTYTIETAIEELAEIAAEEKAE